jgi:dTDP-4-amino-4,6-dideoxygalactose transaminase
LASAGVVADQGTEDEDKGEDMSVAVPSGDRIPFSVTEISLEAREAVERVLASGWVTTGPEVAAFEQEFADAVGARHAVAVASCTAAIELALRALRLPPGSKVLTSDMTFCGAIHAIVHAGLEPVLADVDPETIMPNAETTADAALRAGGVDAMVVLHFAGQPAPVEELAEAAGLPLSRVIEDAAHAFGTWVDDRAVGTISAATCFSFYATKNLPIGEGGMITTGDEAVANYIRRARLHGMSRDAWKRYLPGSGWRYEVDAAGLKANMTDIQAAIGRAQLKAFPAWQARREQLARQYDGRLSGVRGLRTAAWPARGTHAWHLYVIRIEPSFGRDRDALSLSLAERGIDCSVHFIPAHHQPYFRRMLGEDGAQAFPKSDYVFPQILSLPLYPLLSEDEVDRVCDEILSIQGRPRPGLRSVAANGDAEDEGLEWGLSCLIVGTGEPALAIARDLRPFSEFGVRSVGFLDDGARRRVARLPVLGSRSELAAVVVEHEIDLVIIADPVLPAKEIRRLGQAAAASGASVRYLPSTITAESQPAKIRDLRSLNSTATTGRKVHARVP